MLDHRHPAPAAAPIVAIERRNRWRATPVVLFAAILLALGLVAVMPILSPPPITTGLPPGPEARAAAELVRDRFHLDAGGLRVQSSLLGESQGDRPLTSADAAILARAEALLRRGSARAPGDPRVAASIASLDLLRRDLGRAERGYRAALDLGGRYGEARVGLGVTLALRAASSSFPAVARGYLLQSIAQFAAVESRDPAYEVALYDHAVALQRAGRREEAQRRARDYLERDGTSAWAERLRRELGMGE